MEQTTEDSLKKITMDSCMELNRSVSMFLATTKVLTFTALFLLVLMTTDTVETILDIEREDLHLLHKIPDCIKMLEILLLFTGTIIASCGIYGYASLNRHFLAFYGFAIILILLFGLYFGILIVFTNYNNDIISDVFKNQATDPRAQKATDVIQKKFSCCGSEFHNYTQYPSSCCATSREESKENEMEKGREGRLKREFSQCTAENAFKRTCNHSRDTVLGEIVHSDSYYLFGGIAGGFLMVVVTQTALVFHMISRLNTQLSEDILYL